MGQSPNTTKSRSGDAFVPMTSADHISLAWMIMDFQFVVLDQL